MKKVIQFEYLIFVLSRSRQYYLESLHLLKFLMTVGHSLQILLKIFCDTTTPDTIPQA